jgi:hypothetical protein
MIINIINNGNDCMGDCAEGGAFGDDAPVFAWPECDPGVRPTQPRVTIARCTMACTSMALSSVPYW